MVLIFVYSFFFYVLQLIRSKLIWSSDHRNDHAHCSKTKNTNMLFYVTIFIGGCHGSCL